MKYWLFLFVLFFTTATAFSQSVIGKWKTIDDETGKPKSVVELYEKNGKLYGKVVALLNREGQDPDPVCTKCADHRKGKKVVGMQIVSGLEAAGKEWKNGKIMDPENGKEYDCKIWVEDGTLKVRGYVAFFFRTQTWLPYER